ncbi:unnamed protein product [Diabrotica balteata]|uniref:DUF7869 domain-containing protein n=1 Tax=Diabrotica balteata TaxID=107213 RepID=A0A9N9SN32_DIABA|nr:unnamed protein product [Diabrotica balteata]
MKQDAECAKQNPEEITMIAFDLMQTFPTPVISTGNSDEKHQLWTYVLGVHSLATNNAHMYVWNDTQASRGPQEVGSCLLHYFKNVVTKKILYSDQCGGQKRNIKMAVLCDFIVSHPDIVVENIDHKFLVSGHSYLVCDQVFGVISKQKVFFKDI